MGISPARRTNSNTPVGDQRNRVLRSVCSKIDFWHGRYRNDREAGRRRRFTRGDSGSRKPARVRKDLAEFRVVIATTKAEGRALCWPGSDSASSSLRSQSCRSPKPARVRKDLAEFRVVIATAKAGDGTVLAW